MKLDKPIKLVYTNTADGDGTRRTMSGVTPATLHHMWWHDVDIPDNDATLHSAVQDGEDILATLGGVATFGGLMETIGKEIFNYRAKSLVSGNA